MTQPGIRTGPSLYNAVDGGLFWPRWKKATAGRLAQERDALATEDTLSLQMTDALKDQGAHEALRSALGDIGKRLES